MEESEILTDGEFFTRVQMEEVFDDSKTFVDSVPRKDPDEIVANMPDEGLKNFVLENFELPERKSVELERGLDIEEYIGKSWDFLLRDHTEDDGTFLGLKKSFVVPGGRFRETYYWDSYFTALGLAENGRMEIFENIMENFADLIERFGFIPNGTRTYYLDRSQPPFFGELMKLYSEEKDFRQASKFLPQLEKEYRFWMETKHSVKTDNVELNRYWSKKDTPRPESFREDRKTAEASGRDKKFFRDIRAACESGWDFSTRWTDGENLENIHTTDLLPVDLNAVLYGVEKQLADWHRRKENFRKAERFEEKAEDRREAFEKFFWSEEESFYFDYNFEEEEKTDRWTLAAVFPLYFGLASDSQADKVAEKLEEDFLMDGGLTTTLSEGFQWDSSNGWPPLQYMAVKGLERYGKDDLADMIRSRWLETCEKVFEEKNVMLEKYNVERPLGEVSDGEYSNQVGFGWTNGVYLALKNSG